MFKTVKIAVAITKLIHQSIEYHTHGTLSISFIIYSKSFNIIQFTINTTNQKNIKNNGKDNIFRIGLIVTFIIHNIIHHNK